MPQARIACTALGHRIKLGVPSKEGCSFTGTPRDVTSDCLKAVIEYVGDDHAITVNVDGVPAYEITVRKIQTEKT